MSLIIVNGQAYDTEQDALRAKLYADLAQNVMGIVRGTWDASANTPTLADGVGTLGWRYDVSVSGSAFKAAVSGDMIEYDGSVWVVIPRYGSGKTAQSDIGGMMVSLTNKTGAPSVKGTIVTASTSTDNSFMVNPIDGDMPMGVVWNSGVADGSDCWVVVAGIAEVLMKNSTDIVRGYVAYSSHTTAGRMDIASSVPASTTHFREIGHTLENKSGGTDILGKCILHFN